MVAKQITTFFLNGKAIKEEKEIAITSEADEIRHLESGVINIYPEMEYQEIEGFGGALTETSAYLYSKMDAAQKKQFLEDYFGENGQGYRFLRMHIDSCDFSLEEYQAVADPIADPDLTTFTIDRDKKYMIPMLKDAMEMTATPFSILLSPWSPPYQWKTPPEAPKNDASVYGGSFLSMLMPTIDYEKPQRNNGGKLKKEHYGDWARYLAKYVNAYLAEGLPVTMMTLQNETIAATNWDSCVWTADEQKEFLQDYLYPTFKEAGLVGKVGLYIWDHNKERIYEFAKEVLDEKTKEMVEGIAFHWYSGDHFEGLSLAHDAFPGMKLMSSECCPLHAPGQSNMLASFMGVSKSVAESNYQDAVDYAHDIIGDLNHGMNRWIDWNLCVDEKGGPRHVPMGFGASVCVKEDGSYEKLLIFDYIGHFSRHIKPGAKRIGYSKCDDKIEITTAKNPDGSLCLVALNKHHSDVSYAIRLGGNVIRIELPANTISTILI